MLAPTTQKVTATVTAGVTNDKSEMKWMALSTIEMAYGNVAEMLRDGRTNQMTARNIGFYGV